MLKRGWTEHEIESFNTLYDSLIAILDTCDRNIYNCLLHRYYFILGFDPNENARDILLGIIVQEMTRRLIEEGSEAEADLSSAPKRSANLSYVILQDLDKIYRGQDANFVRGPIRHQTARFTTNRFTTNQVSDLLLAFLRLSRIDLNLADLYLDYLTDYSQAKERKYGVDELITVFDLYLKMNSRNLQSYRIS